MATKTFDELKQLAIQIRDEKTNKQNTATRVGTEMLEHLNKLEQDYYDKTTINNRTSEYNVSLNHPTSGLSGSNKYDLSSAIAQVPAELRSSGLTVSFLNADGNTEKWEFSGGSWKAGGFEKVGAGKLGELEQTLSKYLLSNNVDVIKAVNEIYMPKEIYDKYPDGVYLWNIGKLRSGNITVQIYGLKSDGSNEKIVDGYYESFGVVEAYTDNGAFIVDMTNLDQTVGAYQDIKIPIKEAATIIENSPRIAYKLGLSKSNKADISNFYNCYLSDTDNYDVVKAVKELYVKKEIYDKYEQVVLYNIGKLRSGNITVQIYGLKSDGGQEEIKNFYTESFGEVEYISNDCSFIIDMTNLDQTAGAYQDIKIPLRKNVTIKEYSPIIYQNSSNNQWYGKKIIWLGTSVPYGQYATKSYALEAANKLGFNLINTSMPGQRIHGYYDEEHDVIMGGQGTIEEPTNAYATTISKSEYIAAKGAGVSTAEIASSSSPWAPNKGGSSYTRTWENIFVEENADADLWVFDVVPNNTNFETTDWDLFDKENWRYSDDSDFSEHRLTFLGALLFLMNKMYELNPKARLVFVLGTTYAYNEGKSNLELVRNAWNIHIIDLWGKINTSLPSIKYLYSEYTGVDGGQKINRHPSTFGHEKMGEMLANELLLIS